ncbi:MAG: hypothetical protein H0U73_00800 [Tatlockia sp.]|nr:hypothetical protein [Tatlockia sp.]
MPKYINGLPAIDKIEDMEANILKEFLSLGICYVRKEIVSETEDIFNCIREKSYQFFSQTRQEKSKVQEYNDRRTIELKEHVERLSFPLTKPPPHFENESKSLLIARENLLSKIVNPLILMMCNNYGKAEIASNLIGSEETYFSIVFYPVCENNEESPLVGLKKHKDLGLLTVLSLTEAGLKRRVSNDKKMNEWIDVKADPDYFVIICGRALQLLLGKDKCQAPSHKVELKEEKRLSMGMFFNPQASLPIKNMFTGEQLFENFIPDYITQMMSKYG